MNSGKNEYVDIRNVKATVFVVSYGHSKIRGTRVFASKEKAEGFMLGWTWEGADRYAEIDERVVE